MHINLGNDGIRSTAINLGSHTFQVVGAAKLLCVTIDNGLTWWSRSHRDWSSHVSNYFLRSLQSEDFLTPELMAVCNLSNYLKLISAFPAWSTSMILYKKGPARERIKESLQDHTKAFLHYYGGSPRYNWTTSPLNSQPSIPLSIWQKYSESWGPPPPPTARCPPPTLAVQWNTTVLSW